MPQAIIIAGNAHRFTEDTFDFRTYLVREAGIGPKRIHESRTAYLDESMLEMHLGRAIAQRTPLPLAVLYCGHGSASGWGLDDVRSFSYARLAGLLAAAKRPIVLVNDCCHAMAAAREFESAKVSPERVSLIAAAEAGETTTGGLVRLVLNGWRQGKPVRFGPELRWGTRLDHLFFPKPPAKKEGE